MAKLIDLVNKKEYEIGERPVIANIIYLGGAAEKKYDPYPHLINRSTKYYIQWDIINPSGKIVRVDWTRNLYTMFSGRTAQEKKQYITNSNPSFPLLHGDIIRIDDEDRKEDLWKYNFLYKI
jgi:hypothetical protein